MSDRWTMFAKTQPLECSGSERTTTKKRSTTAAQTDNESAPRGKDEDDAQTAKDERPGDDVGGAQTPKKALPNRSTDAQTRAPQ